MLNRRTKDEIEKAQVKQNTLQIIDNLKSIKALLSQQTNIDFSEVVTAIEEVHNSINDLDLRDRNLFIEQKNLINKLGKEYEQIVNRLITKIEAVRTNKPQSIPISQQDDLVYTAPSNQVTIDFENKLLLLDEYATYVVPEIYSKWKDSLLDDFNAQYDLAFEAVGGQQISGSSYIPFYTFLINGWRVKPYESNQHITVNEGVLLTSEGDDPFVDTEGGYNIRVRYEQPVQAIALATSGVGPADVWSYANRSLSQAGVEAITNGLAKTTDLEGLNDVSKEEVRTEIDNALTTYDPPTKSELDTAEQNIKDKIDSKATGLTETEHDKLMSLKNANIIVGKKIL